MPGIGAPLAVKIACKFRADPMPHPTRTSLIVAAMLALAAGIWAPAVHADLADRRQSIVVEADRPGTVDLQRQVIVFAGNVQIVQGTMQIRADRVEVRERPDGSRSAIARGEGGRLASYRQKREGLDEVVEGSAERIEYDGATGTLRLVGQGTVRRLRAGVVADEITGALITWDDSAELFSVAGSAPGEGPPGRVRAVLTPRAAGPSASAAASGPAAPRER